MKLKVTDLEGQRAGRGLRWHIMKEKAMSSIDGDLALSYLDSLISRHSEEIEMLLASKPKPVPALNRARTRIRELLDLKAAYLSKDPSRAGDIRRLREESEMFAF